MSDIPLECGNIDSKEGPSNNDKSRFNFLRKVERCLKAFSSSVWLSNVNSVFKQFEKVSNGYFLQQNVKFSVFNVQILAIIARIYVDLPNS